MDESKLKLIDGWIEKARNKCYHAKDLIKSRTQFSEVIQESQECIELSVKSLLLLLEIDFPHKHGWDLDSNQISEIIKELKSKRVKELIETKNLQYIVRLPRLLFLINFWSKFYSAAKYGISKEYFAPANELFQKDEAELSIIHADECYGAVTNLRNIIFQ